MDADEETEEAIRENLIIFLSADINKALSAGFLIQSVG